MSEPTADPVPDPVADPVTMEEALEHVAKLAGGYYWALVHTHIPADLAPALVATWHDQYWAQLRDGLAFARRTNLDDLQRENQALLATIQAMVDERTNPCDCALCQRVERTSRALN